jgi:phosphoesterase RecJ-like protein
MAEDRTGGSVTRMTASIPLPEHRRASLERVIDALRSAKSVALTTHVNADGDGAGSEAALASWLSRQGKQVAITNPTPFPRLYRHLIEDESWIVDPGTARTPAALEAADTLVVVDTSERSRIGRIASALKRCAVVVIDHHLPSEEPIEGVAIEDDTACATGELIHDLLAVAGEPAPWPHPVARGVYTAVVTDTGSFRFSNTSARAHAVAGAMIAMGVDPEQVYRDVYASVPIRRMRLLERALGRLQFDEDLGITWITIERQAMKDTGTTNEDLDGIVDLARTVDGTEVAILFRETADGSTKISLRSSGPTDVNAIARRFGGGGHRKASGALVAGPVDEVRGRVLDAVRAALRAGSHAISQPPGAP